MTELDQRYEKLYTMLEEDQEACLNLMLNFNEYLLDWVRPKFSCQCITCTGINPSIKYSS